MPLVNCFDKILENETNPLEVHHHKKLILILVILLTLSVITSAWFWATHPTHFKYNDQFVIGNTVEQIVSEYGAFDKVFYDDENSTTMVSAGYLVEAPRVTNLGTTRPKYYVIRFENGIAASVKIETGGWGG